MSDTMDVSARRSRHLRVDQRTTIFARRIAGAVFLMLLVSACGASPPPTQDASGRAGLIVGLPDGSFSATCVTFEGTETSGQALLRQSGFDVTMDEGNALGSLVCSIGGEGCRYPDETCLCRCRGAGPCSYWAYFNWTDATGWVYAVLGARLRLLRDGDLDAWIWLDRSLPSDEIPLPPDEFTFDSVCG